MRYVSSELTHFVGRSLGTDSERFHLLSRIIEGRALIDPRHKDRSDCIFMGGLRNLDTGEVIEGVEYSSVPNVRHDMKARLSDNQLVQFEMVCFCDIPLEAMQIHCSKYGRFGLAFSKHFLIRQGACPVMYVPKSGAFSMKLRERTVENRRVVVRRTKGSEPWRSHG